MKSSVWIRNVRPLGAASVDVQVIDGTIAALAPHGSAPPASGDTVIDGGGALLLPGFVEGHTHLDKSTGARRGIATKSGRGSTDRIENERRWREASGPRRGARSRSRSRARSCGRARRVCARTSISIPMRACAISKACSRRATRCATCSTCRSSRFRSRACSGVRARDELLDARARRRRGRARRARSRADRRRSGRVARHRRSRSRRTHRKPIDIHLHEPGEIGAFTFGLLLDRVEAHGHARAGRREPRVLSGRAARARTRCAARTDRALRVALLTTAPPRRPVPPLQACTREGRHDVRRQRRHPRYVDALRLARHARTRDADRHALRPAPRRRTRDRVRLRQQRGGARLRFRPTTACTPARARTSCWSMRRPSRMRSRAAGAQASSWRTASIIAADFAR